ncbi:Bifunctional pyrimidine biosynthesis protein [Mycena chlorophos]|uniref:Bifunctional pyrimidine biosynthesis protein n=1 Tax=Mycena chlorophos TaxID=658473 RepID=A0A8H6T8E2_MYCCL|nr:Bifunctional pyrimidine biosynthesis protein [Mycena chlorophos]
MSHRSPFTAASGTVDHAEYLRILAELEAERAARVALETHYHTIMEQHTANTAALAETRQQVRALRTKVVAATTQGQQLFRAQGDKIVSLRRTGEDRELVLALLASEASPLYTTLTTVPLPVAILDRPAPAPALSQPVASPPSRTGSIPGAADASADAEAEVAPSLAEPSSLSSSLDNDDCSRLGGPVSPPAPAPTEAAESGSSASSAMDLLVAIYPRPWSRVPVGFQPQVKPALTNVNSGLVQLPDLANITNRILWPSRRQRPFMQNQSPTKTECRKTPKSCSGPSGRRKSRSEAACIKMRRSAWCHSEFRGPSEPAVIRLDERVWCGEFDRATEDAADTGARSALRDVTNKRRGDKRVKEEKFLEANMTLKPVVHEIRIQNQVIFLDPPIEYARANWIRQLHDWLGVVCRLRRIQSSRYEGAGVTETNYTALLMQLPEAVLQRPFSLIEAKVQQVTAYVGKWLQFQSLWDLEAEYVFNRLGDSLQNWQQLLTEIKKTRSTFDTSETHGGEPPLRKEPTSYEEAEAYCAKVGYAVLVCPSYVLSGAAMNVISTVDDLSNYLAQATEVSRDHPVVITKSSCNTSRSAWRTPVSDATLIHPPQDLDPQTVRRIEDATAKIGNALNVTGPFNIQFIAGNNEIKVIECNLRAARSFPFVSKVTGIDRDGCEADYVGIKVPPFSFGRLSGADPVLGVEMASTGEVACFGREKYEAYLKALISTGIVPPKKIILFSVGSYRDKLEILPSVQKLSAAGYNIFLTPGTADFLTQHNVPCKYLETLVDGQDQQKSEYSLTQYLANNLIDAYQPAVEETLPPPRQLQQQGLPHSAFGR